MAALAMWMQETGTGALSPNAERWFIICLVIIAFSMLVQALVYIVSGLVAMKVVKELKGTIDEVRRDVQVSTAEVKAKIYPLVDGIMHMGRTAQDVVDQAAPRVKVITEHLVETSQVVRDTAHKLSETAEKLGETVTQVNQRTQRQVARVDGMVTAALDTTADVVASVEHGIKVPAQKIAQAATQARFVVEGVLERVKAMASGLPFMQQKAAPRQPERPRGPAYPPRPAGPAPEFPSRVNASSTGTTVASGTGPVPLVK